MSLNPTNGVDISFSSYVNQRKRELSGHMINGIPDYTFPLDYSLRQKINSVPGMFQLFKAIMTYLVPFKRQEMNLSDIAVGPNQYPEIYAIGEECARRLGIGVPKIFVKYDVYINACAYASEDAEPVIEINSALIDTFSLDEIRTIVGHECGHIHNNHTIYNVAAQIVAGTLEIALVKAIPGLAQLISLLSVGAKMLLATWSRAAEVTCDRAGMICSNSYNDAAMALAKLGFGGIQAMQHINLDEYIKQVEKMQQTVVRFEELNADHPLTPKRVLAAKLFSECETLYSWRPDWKSSDMDLVSKAETDKKCESFIAVSSKKMAR
ncbi:MAG TPA: M48 family metallopeptidase [Syntrophomonadaceae bacterium]|nr:M48 family metallopeptidase [Syntrophomonadaceae bacterium]